jgi:flagellar biosynthetic protein FliQ
MTAFWLSAPLLIVAFIAGIVINIIQIATSLQDSAFSTIPKLAALALGFILLLPWMLNKLTGYTVVLFSDLARHAR